MANFDFNATEIDTTDEYAPVPEGIYEATITNSAIVPTKAGNGKLLKLDIKLDNGRTLFERLSLFPPVNATENQIKAQQIAKKTLARICKALDIDAFADTSELHGRPFKVHVIIDKKDSNYNDIKSYMALGDEAPVVKAEAKPKTAKPAPQAVDTDDDIPF